jgi:hypothetical protein
LHDDSLARRLSGGGSNRAWRNDAGRDQRSDKTSIHDQRSTANLLHKQVPDPGREYHERRARESARRYSDRRAHV